MSSLFSQRLLRPQCKKEAEVLRPNSSQSIQQYGLGLLKPLLLFIILFCPFFPDLSGKLFTFPQPTNTVHVKLNPTKQGYNFNNYMFVSSNSSVTDLKRDHTLFSVPTPNMLHSICTTWDSVTGLIQIWFDGNPSIRKCVRSGAIGNSVIALLGQIKTAMVGGFDISQSSVGLMSNVHMWDHTLCPCEIQKYMDKGIFIPGNVLNWKALNLRLLLPSLSVSKTFKSSQKPRGNYGL
uniref:Pentraxin family member n=1 Tax=Oryzias latipes TaxID=8090 RepID=H2LWM4_ORYLA